MVLKEYKQFRVEDLPMPEYGHEDILIRVKACAICGSDGMEWSFQGGVYHYYHGA